MVRPSDVRKSQRYSKTNSKTKNIEIKEEPKKSLSKTIICEIEKKSENLESNEEDSSNKISVEEENSDDEKNYSLGNQKTDTSEIPVEKNPGKCPQLQICIKTLPVN